MDLALAYISPGGFPAAHWLTAFDRLVLGLALYFAFGVLLHLARELAEREHWRRHRPVRPPDVSTGPTVLR
ncbi:MAG: hypothetical protein H6828_10260 [Planctomycetes bacterium]|nr:hypothetical protein [Planctomycetota bacterium]